MQNEKQIEEKSEQTEELTKAQKERIEKNKQKAITLKNSRLTLHPYSKGEVVSIDKNTIKIGTTKYKDTGGGFLLEEIDEADAAAIKFIAEQPPIFEPDRPTCEECKKIFPKSYLFDNFACKICDECRNPEVHKLITKTEAQNEYLLKDCDLFKREPPLKYITSKNPHNPRWGEMKLFLQIQVEKRALEIWGSEEKIKEEMEKREEKKLVNKTKKYHKQLKELRMSMRSSLYDRTSAATHIHEFGPDTYNEEEDNYTHSCKTCEYVETFEKM